MTYLRFVIPTVFASLAAGAMFAANSEPCLVGTLPSPGFVSERFLLPVYYTGVLHGALGSRWITETLVSNAGSEPVEIANVGGFGPFDPVYNKPIAPGVTKELFFSGFHETEIPGRFLDIQAGATGVAVQLRVRDASREEISLGAEIPVVQGSRAVAGTINLANIPIRSNYRALLRIYDFSQTPNAVVRVRVFDTPLTTATSPDPLIKETVVTLITRDCDQPGFAQLQDVSSLATSGASGLVRIELQPEDSRTRLWAMITLTNNDTQQVTVVSPK